MKRFRPPVKIWVKGFKFRYLHKDPCGNYVYGNAFSETGKMHYLVTKEWFKKRKAAGK